MATCINTNTNEWKTLSSQTGDYLAKMIFVQYGYEYPTLVKTTDLKKAISWQPNVESFALIGRKLANYNAKNGTSHSFSKKPGYGNTWDLTLHMNYLPRNVEMRRLREAVKKDIFFVEDYPNSIEEAKEYHGIDYTPSISEMQAGRFDENGDFKPNADFENEDYSLPTSSNQVKHSMKASTIQVTKGVPELFESNPELANEVYETLGFVPSMTAFDSNYEKVKEEMSNVNSNFVDNLIDAGLGHKYFKEVVLNIDDLDLFQKTKGWSQNESDYLKEELKDIKNQKNPILINDKGQVVEGWHRIHSLKANGVKTIKAYIPITPQQKQQAQQQYSQYLSQNPNGTIEQFKNWVDLPFQKIPSNSENIDYLIKTAPDKIARKERDRAKAIDEKMIALKQIIRNSKNVEEVKKANVELDQLRNAKDLIREQIAKAEKITKYEDVLEHGEEQLGEIEALLRNNKVSPSEVNYGLKIIDLWNRIGDFSGDPRDHMILDEDEFNTDEIQNQFKLLANRAEKIESRLNQLREKYSLDFANQQTNMNLSREEMFRPVEDVSKIAADTLNYGRVNDTLSNATYYAVNRANLEAKIEANEIWITLDDLSKKVLKKQGSYEIYQQLTKDGKRTSRMVDRFSSSFYSERERLHKNAFKSFDENGKAIKDPNAVKGYFDWIKKNTFTIDNRILFPDSQLIDSHIDSSFLYPQDDFAKRNYESHLKELNENLGEKGAIKYLADQKRLIEQFKIARQGVYENIQNTEGTEQEKRVLFDDWLKENSPYWASDMIENPANRNKDKTSFYKMGGLRYVIQVPVKKVDGKDSEWYDKNFEKIENDEDLLAFYDFFKSTMKQMYYLLPESKRKNMGVGVIPNMSKSIADIFSEKGMMMGITPFIDAIKSMQTTTDLARINKGDKDDKNININFISENSEKIRKLTKIKKIEFEQKNNRPPNGTELRSLREDAANEVSQEQSWDLSKLLKAYSIEILAHKHKSRIEPFIRLIETSQKKRKEVVKNKAGEVMYEEDRKGNRTLQTQEGLKQLKELEEFFLDSDFYNIGSRKVQGASKKKSYSKKENERKKQLEELLEKAKTTEEKDFIQDELNLLGGFKTASGVGDTALKYMTLKSLGWNFFSAFSNVGFGVISNITNSSDGREFGNDKVSGMSNMRKAYLLTLNSIGRNTSFNQWEGVNSNAYKIRTLMDKYDFLQTSRNELFQSSKKSSLSKLKKFGPFTLQERTEYLNQAPIMIASMMKLKAKNEKGEEVTYWEALDKEGNLKEGFTSDVDELKMAQGINRIIEMNHGDYANPLKAKTTFQGRALTMFRTWMFEGFANRFESGKDAMGNDKIDHAVSYIAGKPYIRKGRYRSYTGGQMVAAGAVVGSAILPGVGTAIGAGIGAVVGKFSGVKSEKSMMGETLFTLKQLARKLMFKKTQFDEAGFTEVDAANMRKNMTELYMFVALAGIALLIKAGVDDDDEENKFIVNFLLNQTTRLQTDIGLYTNPTEAEKLTKTAVPLAGLIEDAGIWLEDVSKLFDEDSKNDTFRSGIFKDEYKLLIHTGRFVPGVVMIERAMRTKEKVFE